jgi:RNA polymerase sigma factor (sigma-70 family)
MIPIESLFSWLPGSSPEPAGEGAEDRPSAEAVARRLIAETLPRLDEERRLVMALCYYEELQLPEIAKALGLPVAHVRKLHAETLSMLDSELEKILGPRNRARGRRP